ncbi:hypothetical protein ACSFA3_13785 [Variovorax sp. RHLX14]|uniref:hypothetical protein n=1 Tax=Variovorax sp. RHLX14 TaxID=1259731 RepID=UPI003F4667D8
MIISKPASTAVSSTPDASRKAPHAELQEKPSFSRPKPAVDGASVSKIYNLNNPTHVQMKLKNEQLARETGPSLRALKDLSSKHGNCSLHIKTGSHDAVLLMGTSAHHTLRFDAAGKNTVTIKNGEFTSFTGKVSPVALNTALSHAVAALRAPGAEKLLRSNG